MTLRDVFRPDARRLLAFAGFAFLCVAGAIQSYVFVDDVPGLAKPPLYDLLRPVDFWFPWMLFTAPLQFLAYAVCRFVDVCTLIFAGFPDMGAAKFPVVGIAYSFVFGFWVVYSYDRWLRGARRGRAVTAVGCFVITGAMTLPSLILSMILKIGVSMSVSRFLLTYIIMASDLIAGYGIYRLLLSQFAGKAWQLAVGSKRQGSALSSLAET